MPVFSIIIPYYNTESKYYKSTFDSLKNIPRGVAEILVIDDGSKPDAYHDLERYLADEIPAVKLFRKENGGQNSARQFGIEHAKGSYVLFLDSDDYLDAAALLVLATYLENHKPDVVAFNYDIVSSGGKLLQVCAPWATGFNEINLQRLSLSSDSLWRQCYRLQRLNELRFGLVQGVKIGEDLSSALSINLSLFDCRSFGSVLYHYVKRPTSIIHNPPIDSAYDVLKSFGEVVYRCGPSYSGCYEEVEWMAVLHCVGWNSLRLLRSGTNPQEAKSLTFQWMQDRFPTWKQNSYIHASSIGKKIWFRLALSGHWSTLSLCIRFWDRLKRAIHGGAL